MRDRNQRRIDDGGMLVQGVFHLDAIDIFAAADQHVLGPIEDVAEAFVVEPRDVASTQPAVNKRHGGGVGIAPITLHHVRALDPKFADAADRQFLARVVHDLYVADRQRRPAARRVPLVVFGLVTGERA